MSVEAGVVPPIPTELFQPSQTAQSRNEHQQYPVELYVPVDLGREEEISSNMSLILVPSPDIAKSFFENEYGSREIFLQFHVNKVFPNHKPVAWEFIETFLAEKDDYVDSSHAEGLHGPQHEGRALLNFLMLAQEEGLNEEETIIGCITAWAHDLARKNDIKDMGHGSASSIHLLTKMKPAMIEKLRRLKEKKLIDIELTDESVNKMIGTVMDICTWHEYPYGKVPDAIKEGKYGHLFRVFTDADKLDGDRDNVIKPGTEENPEPSREWWTKPRYLRTNSGRKLFFWGTPRYLTLSSENERLNEGLSVKEIIKIKALELNIAVDISSLPSEGESRLVYDVA